MQQVLSPTKSHFSYCSNFSKTILNGLIRKKFNTGLITFRLLTWSIVIRLFSPIYYAAGHEIVVVVVVVKRRIQARSHEALITMLDTMIYGLYLYHNLKGHKCNW